MEKKKVLASSIIVVFIAFIISSMLLVSKKPDISKISKAQQIAEYTKPAVVRIVNAAIVKWRYTPDSDTYFYYLDSAIMEYLKSVNYETSEITAGSGAIINPNGYIITNAHVVELSKQDNVQIAKSQVVDMSIEISKFFNSKYGVNFKPEAVATYLVNHLQIASVDRLIKVILPGSVDLLDGEIKSYGAPTGEGKDVAVIKIEKSNLPSVMLGDSDKIQLQDSIWVFGYPGAADSKLLSKESILVVSITDGKVSATDKKSAQGAPVLQINAAATHGNSGGPLIDEDGNVVGLLTFRSENNPKETQGFNFAVPVNTVKEFVNQAGAKNEEGSVNKLYKEGLQLYWGGYYKDALVKFEAVQRLNSNHSEIKKLISDCQQKSAQSKILWSKYKNVALGLDAVALLCIIALIYLVFIKKRTTTTAEIEIIENRNLNNNQLNEGTIKFVQEEKDINNNVEVKNATILETNKNFNIKARIYAIAGPLEGTVMDLDDNPLVIGRDPRVCKLIFPQDCIEIGRKHCIVSYDLEKQMFIVEDCSTTNGTFMGDGTKILPEEKRYLKSGDSFYLSSDKYLFEVWLE